MSHALAWAKAKSWAAELPHHDWYVVEYKRGKFDAVRGCDINIRWPMQLAFPSTN